MGASEMAKEEPWPSRHPRSSRRALLFGNGMPLAKITLLYLEGILGDCS
jgi:hypothetical protein